MLGRKPKKTSGSPAADSSSSRSSSQRRRRSGAIGSEHESKPLDAKAAIELAAHTNSHLGKPPMAGAGAASRIRSTARRRPEGAAGGSKQSVRTPSLLDHLAAIEAYENNVREARLGGADKVLLREGDEPLSLSEANDQLNRQRKHYELKLAQAPGAFLAKRLPKPSNDVPPLYTRPSLPSQLNGLTHNCLDAALLIYFFLVLDHYTDQNPYVFYGVFGPNVLYHSLLSIYNIRQVWVSGNRNERIQNAVTAELYEIIKRDWIAAKEEGDVDRKTTPPSGASGVHGGNGGAGDHVSITMTGRAAAGAVARSGSIDSRPIRRRARSHETRPRTSSLGSVASVASTVLSTVENITITAAASVAPAFYMEHVVDQQAHAIAKKQEEDRKKSAARRAARAARTAEVTDSKGSDSSGSTGDDADQALNETRTQVASLIASYVDDLTHQSINKQAATRQVFFLLLACAAPVLLDVLVRTHVISSDSADTNMPYLPAAAACIQAASTLFLWQSVSLQRFNINALKRLLVGDAYSIAAHKLLWHAMLLDNRIKKGANSTVRLPRYSAAHLLPLSLGPLDKASDLLETTKMTTDAREHFKQKVNTLRNHIVGTSRRPRHSINRLRDLEQPASSMVIAVLHFSTYANPALLVAGQPNCRKDPLAQTAAQHLYLWASRIVSVGPPDELPPTVKKEFDRYHQPRLDRIQQRHADAVSAAQRVWFAHTLMAAYFILNAYAVLKARTSGVIMTRAVIGSCLLLHFAYNGVLLCRAQRRPKPVKKRRPKSKIPPRPTAFMRLGAARRAAGRKRTADNVGNTALSVPLLASSHYNTDGASAVGTEASGPNAADRALSNGLLGDPAFLARIAPRQSTGEGSAESPGRKTGYVPPTPPTS